jgi:hypothetical protein
MPQQSLRPSARGRALILIVFVCLYAVASWLPALTLEGAAVHWRGVELLVLGPMGLKSMQFAWLANLFAGLALYRVMNKPGVLVIVLETLALVVAMDTLMLFGQEMPLGDRQGSMVRVVGFASGFYFWLLALAWPFFALMLLRIRPPQRVRGDFNG